MKKLLLIATIGLVMTAPARAAGLEIRIEIPRLTVAEYHRPYVAVWLQHDASNGSPNGSPEDAPVRFTNLAVWYDIAMEEQKGQEWLKDMRQWWRRTGRTLSLPIDGITAATRPPGVHSLVFGDRGRPLPALAPGRYELVVEASREVGGRELISIPFDWPATAAQSLEANGEHELGRIRLEIAP